MSQFYVSQTVGDNFLLGGGVLIVWSPCRLLGDQKKAARHFHDDDTVSPSGFAHSASCQNGWKAFVRSGALLFNSIWCVTKARQIVFLMKPFNNLW